MLPMGQGFMLQEHNSRDIINFVDDKLASNTSVGKSDNDLVFFQDLLVLKEEIIQKADGVFLWVCITCNREWKVGWLTDL